MQTIAANATPSLHEWASFFSKLSERKSTGGPFLTKDESTRKIISHLEVKLPVVRRYSAGRQLKLFSN